MYLCVFAASDFEKGVGARQRSTELKQEDTPSSAAPSDCGNKVSCRLGSFNQSDASMASMLMSLADVTVGNPALMLQNLLGFEPQDYGELLTAQAESGCTYTELIASHIHNLRVSAEEAASDPDLASDMWTITKAT